MSNNNTSQLDPNSREYFDIRLFALIAFASEYANDEMLHTIFNTLTISVGQDFPCHGIEAIKEAKAGVDNMINACVTKNFLAEPKHIQQYATYILAEFVQTADFSGILRHQQKQLTINHGGITQEGINMANKLIMEHLDKYKKVTKVTDIL